MYSTKKYKFLWPETYSNHSTWLKGRDSCKTPANFELACAPGYTKTDLKHGMVNLGPESWRPTTVKWRQFSQSNRHSTIGTRETEYHEALPSSANVQSHLTSSFTDDGNVSWYSACRVSMVEWRLDWEDCRHLTVVGLHDTGPWSSIWWPQTVIFFLTKRNKVVVIVAKLRGKHPDLKPCYSCLSVGRVQDVCFINTRRFWQVLHFVQVSCTEGRSRTLSSFQDLLESMKHT